MKKVLLIQPPQWYPVSPHLAVPLLAAQIKREGFEVKALDLNVKFFNRILQNKNLAEADRQAKRILAELEEKFANADFEAIKKNGISTSEWWLRAAYSYYDNLFYNVVSYGDYDCGSALNTYGVAPAFRIG